MQSVRIVMKYLKVYCNLIRKAENRISPEGYTEKHHTFPVSIFGKNKRIVILTARIKMEINKITNSDIQEVKIY